MAGGAKGTQPTNVNVADAELFDSSSARGQLQRACRLIDLPTLLLLWSGFVVAGDPQSSTAKRWTVGSPGPEETKNLAGNALRLIQTV